MIKAADYIIDFLIAKEIDTVFSLSGGMISNLEDAIFRNKKVRLLSVKHEQAGAFAAEGYARVSGKTGVAMGTSGPGATNMITGIADAFFDSIPVIYISGQVNTNELTINKRIKQTGFQEANIVGLVQSITKFAYQVTSSEEIPEILDKAFRIANEGRKGPVLIDIPMNTQKGELAEYSNTEITYPPQIVSLDFIIPLTEAMVGCSRPIVLLGGGVKIANCKEQVKDFVLKYNIPVVSSLLGLDSFDHTLPNYIGMIGSYGNRYANIILNNSDLVFVFGSRLDIRQTGAQKDRFCEKAKIIHIDIDDAELGYSIEHTHLKIHMDLSDFFDSIVSYSFDLDGKDRMIRSNTLKKHLPQYQSIINDGFYDPNFLAEKFSEYAPDKTIFVNDVGQNQMWTSQSLILREHHQLLNSGGLGAMGFSLPSAMGAFFAKPDYCIVSFNGDGGFQINIQELETIAYHKIPILIVVYNNRALGMIREFQDTYFDGRHAGTILGYSCPDLEKIASAYAIHYAKIDVKTPLDNMLQNLFDNFNFPTIVEIECSQQSIVTPKILFGNTIDNQWPFLTEEEKTEIHSLLFE